MTVSEHMWQVTHSDGTTAEVWIDDATAESVLARGHVDVASRYGAALVLAVSGDLKTRRLHLSPLASM